MVEPAVCDTRGVLAAGRCDTCTEAFCRGHAPQRSSTRLIRFASVGVFNTALDFALLFFFVYQAGLGPVLANVASTGICLIVSFVLNRRWTFQSNGGGLRQFSLFLIVTLSGLWGLQSALLWLAAPSLETFLSPEVALLVGKIIATLGSLTWNYVLYTTVVFTGRRRSDRS